MSRSLVLLSLLLTLAACGPSPRQRVAATLDDVETYINDRPDSALAVLEGVDSTALSTRALRARYSLLHTMTLDKCYKDITRAGLLDDAERWYTAHGTPDERFKTWHYAARIAQDRGDRGVAALNYARAETFSDEVEDRHALGLMYLSFASLYNSVHNTQRELDYIEKALSVFQTIDDPMYSAAIAEKALVYHSRHEWAKADSLYQIGIERTEASYPAALQVYLSNYARMKVLQDETDPAGTIELLDRKRILTGQPMTAAEGGAYAYALALLGNRVGSDTLFRRLDGMSAARSDVLPWQYRRALLDGRTEEALTLLRQMWQEQDATIREDLTESVSSILQDYFFLQAKHEQDRRENILLTAVVVVLLLLGACLALLLRKRRISDDRERLLAICGTLRGELGMKDSRLAAVTGELQTVQAQHAEQSFRLATQLGEAKEAYRRERVARLRQAGTVGSVVMQHERKWIGDERAWSKIRDELLYIHHLEGDGAELIRRLDRDLDGMISRMREELGLRGKPGEVLFLCCCILDLDAQVMAELFGAKSVDAIYKRRSRLKSKVAALGNPEYDFLLKIRTAAFRDEGPGNAI